FSSDLFPPQLLPLSLHDALPIFCRWAPCARHAASRMRTSRSSAEAVESREFLPSTRKGNSVLPEPTRRRSWPNESSPPKRPWKRSEEHTSELQSLTNLVCRLLLE